MSLTTFQKVILRALDEAGRLTSEEALRYCHQHGMSTTNHHHVWQARSSLIKKKIIYVSMSGYMIRVKTAHESVEESLRSSS